MLSNFVISWLSKSLDMFLLIYRSVVIIYLCDGADGTFLDHANGACIAQSLEVLLKLLMSFTFTVLPS